MTGPGDDAVGTVIAASVNRGRGVVGVKGAVKDVAVLLREDRSVALRAATSGDKTADVPATNVVDPCVTALFPIGIVVSGWRARTVVNCGAADGSDGGSTAVSTVVACLRRRLALVEAGGVSSFDT